MVRPLADVLRRSWDIEVRRLSGEASAAQAAMGFHCEAILCRRPDTHIVLFRFRRRGQVLDGESFFCTPHAERYARRRGVRIQASDPEGNTQQ
jgi:hypothetical protein